MHRYSTPRYALDMQRVEQLDRYCESLDRLEITEFALGVAMGMGAILDLIFYVMPVP